MIVLLLAAYGLIFAIDAPSLIQKKYWRELCVFCTLFAAGLVLSFLLIQGVPLPSPIKGIQFVIHDILHLGYPD